MGSKHLDQNYHVGQRLSPKAFTLFPGPKTSCGLLVAWDQKTLSSKAQKNYFTWLILLMHGI